ncbi:MAG: hypothetical protein ABI830_10345, partial [Pseudolabrys sp.]
MRSLAKFGLGLLIAATGGGTAFAQFKDFHGKVDPAWTGPTFKLSQNYPAKAEPQPEPWKTYNFKTQPREYLYAVLAYVLEGNIEVDWRVQDNAKRKWFHVPWMEWDTYGREYARGLTRERNGLLSEMTGDPSKTKKVQSWAVGFYSPPGGVAVGKVWHDPNNPDPKESAFAEGTVVAKLLFSQFDETDLPYLKGTLTWKAAIHKSISCGRLPPLPDGNDPPGCERALPQDMRLIQIDIGVKDKTAGAGHWVMGTFTFNGDLTTDQSPLLPTGAPWNRLVPVGLMWGNDPKLKPSSKAKPKESAITPTGVFQHLGCAGRLNGPVDNPVSSCISCHMQAQFPVTTKPMVPAKCDDSAASMAYFINLKSGKLYDPSVAGAVPLDTS